ncbi:hypothetical protein [Caulobacter phage Cr30]|uniref:DNA binding protein n=1 Tax=Caulobacter phage Cr30 TaxID=1357714 RepID=UPI0004A9B50E|nr:DNA binding protein [Caulobacter phage Cr30]AGS80962.1 hypothetical protein [Caulobacter phage Cr30]
MNIFILDNDPKIAAQMHCDKHIVKMILELAQMLCTSHRILDGADKINSFGDYGKSYHEVELYKTTHPNHPCSIWIRKSHENYIWAFLHFLALSEEYYHRYGKRHKTHEKYWWVLGIYPKNLPANVGLTPFAQAMPDQYKVPGDAVKAYQQYYIGEKDTIAKWKHGNAPQWYTTGLAVRYRNELFQEDGIDYLNVSDQDVINIYQERKKYFQKKKRVKPG